MESPFPLLMRFSSFTCMHGAFLFYLFLSVHCFSLINVFTKVKRITALYSEKGKNIAYDVFKERCGEDAFNRKIEEGEKVFQNN